MEKEYIGDGVYASFDGYWIELTTEYGEGATNRITLEPEVYEALVRFAKKLAAKNGGVES